ncbi:MAG: hypothetical protein OXI30_07230 [Chloroflexota bacterium]|nr:hypothetical protein [Chloroflexota bacterium]
MSPSQRILIERARRLALFIICMSCLCLVAIQAFSLNKMPYSADGLLHLYRAAALEHSLRVDHPLWPRFSSGLAYGYGAPLFSFFPPLAYYPASLGHSLGLSFLSGWLLSMSAYTVLAGIGMYLLGRHWTRSDLGGWLAAAAYIYSPYLLFDSVTRGATAELAALAALPFAFYGLTRLAVRGRRSDFLTALAAFAIFIPLHTVITLHGTALLALYCLFLSWRADDSRSVFFRLALAGGLGLLLTAFYWLPALVERDAIKLPLIAEQLGHIDVTRHLRPLAAVLAFPQAVDPTQQNQALPIAIGWIQLILAALATLLSWRAPNRHYRSLLLFLWLALGALIFLNTPLSAWFWQNIPLIGFTQFPWRALGLASLLLALMSAIGARLLWLGVGDRRGKVAAIVVASMMLVLYATPWTYARYYDNLEVNDISDVQRFERESGQLTLSSYGEYLPVSADASQLEPARLTERFAENDAIARLLPSATVDILAQEWRGTAASLRLESANAQTLILDWLYVPGWIAAIDGRSVDVYPSTPAGLVALDVPAGQFELRVSLAPTAAQSLAAALSIIGLASAVLIALFWRRLGYETANAPAAIESERSWLPLFAAIGVAVFFLKALALDPAETPMNRRQFGVVEDAPALANFGHKIDLLAVDAPVGEITESTVAFTLFWRLHGAPLERDYASIVRMRDPQGLVVAEASSFAPGGLAASNWLPGAYIKDVIELTAPPYTPPLPQAYTFEVGLYDVESLRALSLINAAGDPQDFKYEIAELPLKQGAAAKVAPPLQAAAGDGLAYLVEPPALPKTATAGDALRFSWVWRKLRASAADGSAQLLWLNERGDVAASSASLPLVQGYDFANWRLGEVNRGHHRSIVPASLPAGPYNLYIRPLDAAGLPTGEIIALEQMMTVALPQREFEAPRLEFESGAEWANGIVLHGYAIETNGEVDFVWGANRLLDESLHLFVHALDEDGKIVAQWDGVPADWTRHTTGWIEGEYVTTRHHFALPAGKYRLRLGWYAAATGVRIGVAASDALEIEPLFVIE